MVRLVSSHILNYVLCNLDISSEMKDAYQYGIEITVSSIFNTLLILICSLILGDVIAGLIYLFIFIFLRSFTGGYHATTYFRCNLTFVVTFIITFGLYKIITSFEMPFIVCEIIALLNLITIVVLSPVPNKYKPLTDEQRKRAFILSIVISSILSLSGLTLLMANISAGAIIIMTVTMVSVLMIIETIMQRRGYHEC